MDLTKDKRIPLRIVSVVSTHTIIHNLRDTHHISSLSRSAPSVSLVPTSPPLPLSTLPVRVFYVQGPNHHPLCHVRPSIPSQI